MLHLLFSRHPVRDADYDPRVGFLKEFLTRVGPTAPVTLMLENRGNGMPCDSERVWQLFRELTGSDQKTNDWMMDLVCNAPNVNSAMHLSLQHVFDSQDREFRGILAHTPDALLDAKPSIGNVVRAERDNGRQMRLVVENPIFRAWLCGAAMCANITLAQQHLQNGDLESALAACGHKRVLVNRMFAESDPSIAKQLVSLDTSAEHVVLTMGAGHRRTVCAALDQLHANYEAHCLLQDDHVPETISEEPADTDEGRRLDYVQVISMLVSPVTFNEEGEGAYDPIRNLPLETFESWATFVYGLATMSGDDSFWQTAGQMTSNWLEGLGISTVSTN